MKRNWSGSGSDLVKLGEGSTAGRFMVWWWLIYLNFPGIKRWGTQLELYCISFPAAWYERFWEGKSHGKIWKEFWPSDGKGNSRIYTVMVWKWTNDQTKATQWTKTFDFGLECQDSDSLPSWDFRLENKIIPSIFLKHAGWRVIFSSDSSAFWDASANHHSWFIEANYKSYQSGWIQTTSPRRYQRYPTIMVKGKSSPRTLFQVGEWL